MILIAGDLRRTGSPRVSVLMPTYNQASFIGRAMDSMQAQTQGDWELIVIDDGSIDGTSEVVKPFLADPRTRFHSLLTNRGLGAALNVGLGLAVAPYIAYLPSDDVYYHDHLASLVEALDRDQMAVVAYSGVRHHYNRAASGRINGSPLQLVQVMHRAIDQRWLEREDLVTDDLGQMYWSSLRQRGGEVATGRVTCEWVDHPDQRHKRIQEPVGGINTYRSYFGVSEPLRFHSTVGNHVDEVELYSRFRRRPDTPAAPDGLKILLVGELAYNAERVLALEERGHTLLGLWMPDPYWYNTVGPLPFGHVLDLPRADWQRAVRETRPDLIYAQLNWQAVPFAHHVLCENLGIPFVWHFKEGPFVCLEKGTWSQLIDLHARATGVIYTSPEMREWYETLLPGMTTDKPTLVLDGDLPKQDWLQAPRSMPMSDSDGEIHTVVPGRPIGLHPRNVEALAARGVHLHFYGDFTQGQWREWIVKARQLAPHHFHLHATVNQDGWVREFSQYDAGWLHSFRSENDGDVRRANWDDLNYPARIATLAAAGLPMIQYDNGGSVVATQSLARNLDIGVFFTDEDQLADRLRDSGRMRTLRENVWRQRQLFTFDHHADRLVEFFRALIASYPGRLKH